MKRRLEAALVLFGVLALAAGDIRVITIEYPEGTRSGNLRTGPWVYESEKPDGIKGQVEELQIISAQALLRAPEGKSMQEAEGSRIAEFTGGVTVKRGRVTANGPSLSYDESTGLGVLKGPAQMVQAPSDADDDPVELSANEMAFDVDTDVSRSQGQVKFKSGPQEGQAEQIYFEEERELAILTTPGGRVELVRRRSEGDLRIQAGEVRSLTDSGRLIATGGVVLIDGDLTTKGDSLSYDDNTGEAFVVGKPALSTSEDGEVSAGTLRHDVKEHRVELYGQPYNLPLAEFAPKE